MQRITSGNARLDVRLVDDGKLKAHRIGCLFTRKTARMAWTGLASRLCPHTAAMHPRDLFQDHLVPVLRVLHGRPPQIEILGVYRRLVKDLVQLGAKVL